jgi:hypothetical protein
MILLFIVNFSHINENRRKFFQIHNTIQGVFQAFGKQNQLQSISMAFYTLLAFWPHNPLKWHVTFSLYKMTFFQRTIKTHSLVLTSLMQITRKNSWQFENMPRSPMQEILVTSFMIEAKRIYLQDKEAQEPLVHCSKSGAL